MQKRGSAAAAGAAPTGCFKCGRPGHWSRDCPSTAPNPNSSTSNANSKRFPRSSSIPPPPQTSEEIPGKTGKRVPKTRPKLSPDLLLSEDGLGYVLKHFPRNFKYHGRGREVRDLGKLIGLYSQWHSHLMPYYSFDQFVEKVEKLGGTIRVRRCVAELREKVERGEDPTKLHQAPTESQMEDDGEPGFGNVKEVANEDPPFESQDMDDIQDQMFDEIYRMATDADAGQVTSRIASEAHPKQTTTELTPQDASTVKQPSQNQMTEEQKARMEANRLKALERLTRLSQVPSTVATS